MTSHDSKERDRLNPLDLEKLSAKDIDGAALQLHSLVAGAASREEAADRIVQFLYGLFRRPTQGDPACALVRCFQTATFEALPRDRRDFAASRLGHTAPRDSIRCLAMLATRGIEPDWNSVANSRDHRAIPLPSVEVILRAPMIARLLLEMGIRFEHFVAPPESRSGFLLEKQNTELNIFHVDEALGSRYIPTQATFVHRYRVRSVLGFGGLLPGGELLVFMLFSRVPIPRATAELFRPLAREARQALQPFSDKVFATRSA